MHAGAVGSPRERSGAAGSDRWRSPRNRVNPTHDEPPILTLTLIPEPVKEQAAAPAKDPFGIVRRHATAVAAAVLIGVCGGFAVQFLAKAYSAGHVAAVASAPGPAASAKPDQDLQMAQMTAQIKLLSASLADVKAKLATLRASTDGMSASLEAARADIDRGRQADDIKALKKTVDGLKQGLDQAKADWTASAAQVAQKLDRTDRDPAAKLSQIADRLDRLDRDRAAKLALISDRLDKLEHRPSISADITSSIPKSTTSSPKAAAYATPAAPLPAPKPASLAAPPALVIPGMQVLGVDAGSAFVESRDGGVFELAQGDWIPGVGKVESIERRGGEWVIVTNHGLIGPGRH